MMTTEGISIDVAARAARSCIFTLRECHADMQLGRVGFDPALAKQDGGSERTPCREMQRACHGHRPIPNPRREK